MRYWHLGRGWTRVLPSRWRFAMCCLLAAGMLMPQVRISRATGIGWQAVASVNSGPAPRGQYGMASDGLGHLYLYGGNAGLDAALGDFWEYNTATSSWLALPNSTVPPLIEPHLAVDDQGNVWEFGGIAGTDAPHLTADDHSYGLYEYTPSLGYWRDLTPSNIVPDVNWPAGREDLGFAFDSQKNELMVFAGEGQGDATLNDLWSYSVQNGTWNRIDQQYAGSDGTAIAPREVYNVSADKLGHLYLFGGAFLAAPYGAGANHYANDLWRYDDATQTWTLLTGIPNGYDPNQPLPRHYYGQTVDAAGNFDILGGYLFAPEAPPFFDQSTFASYAQPAQFTAGSEPGNYGLSDFWQFDISTGWHDRSKDMGAL
ncbi:MAG: Ig-like, group 2, partial [Chloroflexi bacterium]|nr:Ig-like, group 2 [Chloroflexota bacterium]